MSAPDLKEFLKQEAARRHELDKLEETQKWVHHAFDLGAGRVLSSTLCSAHCGVVPTTTTSPTWPRL